MFRALCCPSHRFVLEVTLGIIFLAGFNRRVVGSLAIRAFRSGSGEVLVLFLRIPYGGMLPY